MMRYFLLSGLFVMSMGQAEVLPESLIQQIQAKVHAVCIKSDLKQNDMTPDELAAVCSCKETTMASKLRAMQFSSISKPTQADHDLIPKAESAAAKECLKPLHEKWLVDRTVPACLANANSDSHLKGLSREDQESRCTCAARHIANYMDFDDFTRLDKAKQQPRIEAEWDASFKECSKM